MGVGITNAETPVAASTEPMHSTIVAPAVFAEPVASEPISSDRVAESPVLKPIGSAAQIALSQEIKKSLDAEAFRLARQASERQAKEAAERRVRERCRR